MSQPFLSVIIPAYNEESRIVDTLRQVLDYLGSQPYTWEVVVVDDGSTDTTPSLVDTFSKDYTNVRLIRVPHGGKGWAVNQGMLSTAAEYRFMCDADLSMPIDQINRFLPPGKTDFDIAIGSREIPGARRIGEPYRRHLMGRLYNLLVRLLIIPNISDTQCGFKCFQGEVADKLFPLQKMNGFAFDVELLFLARKKTVRVEEIPIDWYYMPQSKVRAVKDSFAMTGSILKIRWNNLLGRYRRVPEPIREDGN